jgi:ABC-type uncharacterized transport system permease subunit
MARSRFERSRRFHVPAAVALVGVAISFAVFVAFETAEAAAASDHLADTGQKIVRVLEDLQAIALSRYWQFKRSTSRAHPSPTKSSPTPWR